MGFYTIEHHHTDVIGPAFHRDWYDLEAQLQGVERALNVFDDAGESTRANTRLLQPEGITAFLVNHAVNHPVLGITYFREAIDWMRSTAGAEPFGWVSVPPASDWDLPPEDPDAERCGFNRRWINEIRQAIGRIVDQSGTSIYRQYRTIVGTFGYDGAIAWKTPQRWKFGPAVGGGRVNVSSQYGARLDPSTHHSLKAYNRQPSPPHITIDDDGDITGWRNSPTFDGFGGGLEVIERGAFTEGLPIPEEILDPFEQAYSSYVVQQTLSGSTAPPSPGVQVPSDSITYEYWDAHAEITLHYLRDPVPPEKYDVWVNESPSPSEISIVQSLYPTQEEWSGTTQFCSGGALPTTISQVVQGGSFDVESTFVWCKPHEWADLFQSLTPDPPRIQSQFNAWRQAALAYVEGTQPPNIISKSGSALGRETYGAGIQGSGYFSDPSTIKDERNLWIYWTQEVRPMAEGWPTDEFTYEA